MLVLCLCIAIVKVLLRMFQNTFVSGSLEKIFILMRITVRKKIRLLLFYLKISFRSIWFQVFLSVGLAELGMRRYWVCISKRSLAWGSPWGDKQTIWLVPPWKDSWQSLQLLVFTQKKPWIGWWIQCITLKKIDKILGNKLDYICLLYTETT